MFNDLLNQFKFAERETVDEERRGQRRLPAGGIITLATVAVAGPVSDNCITWGGLGNNRAGNTTTAQQQHRLLLYLISKCVHAIGRNRVT